MEDTLKEAKSRLAQAELAITEILNDLEKDIGGDIIDVDTSVREINKKGERIPYVRINFKLDTN